MTALPGFALSVRQPWAWAIIHAGKDIENRSRRAMTLGGMAPHRIAIHAAIGMTRYEYGSAAAFMADLGITCPAPADLLRGGIIGSVEVVDIVRQHHSRWFFGPWGLVLRNPIPCEFIPCRGALGFFKWDAGDAPALPPHAKWMLPPEDGARPVAADEIRHPTLFAEQE